jgi:hypothetical protein
VGFVVNANEAPERGERNFMQYVFCRPIRGWEFLFGILPTVAPWATFCRASGALAALVLFFAVGAIAQTNGLSDAEIQGRQLARQLCDAKPAENYTNTATLKIFRKHDSSSVRVCFTTAFTTTNWLCIYEGTQTAILSIVHTSGSENKYFYMPLLGDGPMPRSIFDSQYLNNGLEKADLLFPFCGSDFWLCDLGLEFFHWPHQKILPKTTTLKRSREYTLLESTNPNPPTNGYSRVLSWIDKESGGILQAEAYDAQGKLLKVFEPKSFKKVNGQWELQEMEIRNVQTGSRTRLEFDLNNN